jgi:benzoyl-CoA reductase/2-hydroxyglutaryl-CoA dehydratase subunit BcrC/BadD/HgdB
MTFSDAERKVKELQRIIDKKKLSKKEQFKGPKIGLVASCIPETIGKVIELIEEQDARIVFDDICIGSRHFEGLVDESIAPMDAIARRYLTTANCPHTATSRASFIQEKITDKKIDGLVFFGLKFCDGAAWDYVANKPSLDREGIPNIRIEAELGGVDQELLRTRLGAFIEILENKK